MLGIVSERDIVRSIATNGARTLEMTAGQLMTRAVHLAHPNMTVEEAMRKMTVGRIRHLPVVEGQTLIGLVSIGDLVKHRMDKIEAEAAAIAEVRAKSADVAIEAARILLTKKVGQSGDALVDKAIQDVGARLN